MTMFCVATLQAKVFYISFKYEAASSRMKVNGMEGEVMMIIVASLYDFHYI